ncbi:unnamed protein product, partial [Oncorhynchus mykiss]
LNSVVGSQVLCCNTTNPFVPGNTPVYDLLKAEGQAHQPNFTFRVSVGEISCTGQGPSKKAAKHKAAEAALKMMKGGLGGPVVLGEGLGEGFIGAEEPLDGDSSPSEMKTSGSGTSQQSECNPVGALQVRCIRVHLQMNSVLSELHFEPLSTQFNKLYCYRCVHIHQDSSWSWSPGQTEQSGEKGLGQGEPSRRTTISAALTNLGVCQKAPKGLSDHDETEIELFGLNAKQYCCGKVKGSEYFLNILCIDQGFPTLFLESYPHVGFHSNPVPGKLPSCSSLCECDQAVMYEPNVCFLDVPEERSLSGLCQCLVELSTQPITVCHGFAPNQDGARASAAHNALQYLKIMAGGK